MNRTLTAVTAAVALSVAGVALMLTPRATRAAAELGTKPAPADPASAPTVVPLSKEDADFFEAKVRPVLSANCYECHSAETKKAKGGLLLDTRQGWATGGKSGPAVVPGDVAKSTLLRAVHYEDPDLQMPPDGKLADKDVAALEEWVKRGAPDPRVAPADPAAGKLTGLTDRARAHWAFQPVKQSAVPQSWDEPADAAWVKTPVDAFVLARLRQNGMRPSPAATRETLIRRATYDLIGLPPTPEDVAAFVNDPSPNAFAAVVDRLLASPHYGERWGRFWLDTARYSDTTGAEDRKAEYRYPFAWTYRDYVIDSFNADKPYDQFLKEQIAADLLPESKSEPARLAALGFLTVGKRFQNPNDTIDERIDAVTKGTMALTVSCARCHDHKFDPVPTADYYSLHGVFASTTEPPVKPLIGAEPTGPEYEDFKARLAELERKDRQTYYVLLAEKSAEFRRKASAYLFVASLPAKSQSAEMLKLRNRVIEEERLDRDLYQNGPARGRKAAAVFAPLQAFAALPPDQFATRAKEVLATIVGGGEGGRPRKRVNVNPLVARAFADVDPDSLRSLRDVTDVYGRLFAGIEPQARAYLEVCRTATGPSVAGFDEDLVELISVPAEIEPAATLTTERLAELAPTLPVRNKGGYGQFRLGQIAELMLTHPGSPARAMVVADAERPKDSPIFIRGDQRARGPVVPRRFLEILSGKDRKPFSDGSGRLELANAIASKDNPLTARAMVNRIWMHHFGQGFVRTPDDLGVQSEPPSHTELLDYLASRFVADGWSVKRLHRLIMLSSTYQQSSDTNAAYAEKEPDNRLLWRANVRRLDFEAVRDSMLAFTGKLDPTVGGKPVNLTDEPYSNRRSVYGYIDRGGVPELMAQFDFADPDMVNSRRTTTVVPQQALFFMNSPMAVDVARKVTSRPEFLAADDDAGRVKALYEVLFQRQPRPEEVRLAVEFVASAGDGGGEELAGSSTPADEIRGENVAAKRRAEKRKLAAKAAQVKPARQGRRAIRNEGEAVERRPLTAWEQYAQALLFTNEIAYVN